MKPQDLYRKLLQEQLQWLQDHGGDRAGYIANYHGKYGRTIENAEAIYNADLQELHRIQEKLR